jgi:hypothetical protein
MYLLAKFRPSFAGYDDVFFINRFLISTAGAGWFYKML